MPEPVLWTLSLQAFAAVVVVLTLLAGALMALTALFRPAPTPPPGAAGSRPDERGPDPFVVAAVHAAARTAHPGARVVHLEEIPHGGVDDPR